MVLPLDEDLAGFLDKNVVLITNFEKPVVRLVGHEIREGTV